MTRIEQEPQKAKVVSAADFEKDFSFGCVAMEYNPPREEILIDHRSGKRLVRQLDADIVYRCVDCQFDSMDKKLLDEHRAEGVHPWLYGPFQNPYGHVADVEIEGIEDYGTWLKEKHKCL